MRRVLPQKRPNCEKILERNNSWAPNGEEFEISNELKNKLIRKLVDENKIVLSLLKSNLNI
jgi:hypothetical protein